MKPTTYYFECTWGSIARLPSSRTIKSRFLEQNSSLTEATENIEKLSKNILIF